MEGFAVKFSSVKTLIGTSLAFGLVLALSPSTAFGQMQENRIVIDGSTTVGPIAKAFAEFYMRENPGVNITVSESGSGNGAKSLMNKACDVADMSRFMKDNEFQAAVGEGIFPVAHVVALDGLAVILHPSNPVRELTVEQVKNIYLGRVTNWQQVGGPNQSIIIVSRDTNSGTYETFEGLVMNSEQIAQNAEYVGSNGAVRQRVQSTRNAIGYVGLGFVDRTVKALVVDGVEPTPQTIVTGAYPIARPLYMFTNGYPTLGSHLHRFVTLHLTERGQEIVEEIGFVPVTSYR
jgi:phosphate transport system substrate-binding protein